MADIVAVADERDPQPRQLAELLLEGHDVRQSLAGMVIVGQGVDDRDRGVASQLLDPGLLEGPNRDRTEVAGQDSGRVGDGLAPAELELVGAEGYGQHAQTPGSGLEADARPRRRLVEDEPDPPAGKRILSHPLDGLEVAGQFQVDENPVSSERIQSQEVARHDGALQLAARTRRRVAARTLDDRGEEFGEVRLLVPGRVARKLLELVADANHGLL